MAEPNNTNAVADAYLIAAGVGRLSVADRALYAAMARTWATRAPTMQNSQFWLDLAALIQLSASAGTPAATAAVAAIKRSGLSVSASTYSQLMALGLEVQAKFVQRAPNWPWIAAAGVGLWLLARRRRAA